jgi:hypothetical protein
VPDGIDSSVNRPSASVVYDLVKFVFTFLASTVAPETTAPCSSVKIPWIDPEVVSWANTPTEHIAKKIKQILARSHDLL